MDFLILGRAAMDAGADSDTPELDEAHWSYLDAFADRMTARGPTLSPDRQIWTGSLHVVDLPDLQAAEAFAANDPYHRAGLFAEHLIRRFDNLLGRTMWDFPRRDDGLPFLVLADAHAHAHAAADLATARATELATDLADRLVLRGTLRSPDGRVPTGAVLALVASGPDAVRSLLADRPDLLGGPVPAQLHAWEFGGRR